MYIGGLCVNAPPPKENYRYIILVFNYFKLLEKNKFTVFCKIKKEIKKENILN